MHRDLKLGLALAVLLIGSTTAFFFRDDVGPDSGLPRLQDPERLDGEIADRGVIPYLGQPEMISEADTGAAVERAQSVWTKPAFLGGMNSGVIRRTSLTPDPIQIVLEEEAELLESVSTPNVRPLLMTTIVDENGERFYVVQPGDTLTGIASKLLGSLSRYREIYELNLDRLAGPHDLRIGMKLRIPPAHAALAKAVTPVDHVPASLTGGMKDGPDAEIGEADAASDTADIPSDVGKSRTGDKPETPTASASSHGEKLFIPAKRAPFVPSRYRGRASISTETDALAQ